MIITYHLIYFFSQDHKFVQCVESMAQISKFSLMSMINGLKLPLDVKLHVWEKNVLINNPTKLISIAKNLFKFL